MPRPAAAFRPDRPCTLLTALIVTISIISMVPAVSAAPPARLLILPFDIHAAEDMNYLNEGIADMLATRLSVPGRIAVVRGSAPAKNDQKAIAMAQKAGADHVLVGAITIVKPNVNTDARLLQTENGKIVFTFSQFADSTGAVLRHINQLTDDLRAFFSRNDQAARLKTRPTTVTAPRQDTVPAGAAGTSAAAAAGTTDVTATGSTLKTDTAPSTTAASPLAGKAAPATKPVVSADTIWRSRPLNMNISAMTIADIDHDGRMEAVVCGRQKIKAFHWNKERLTPVATYAIAKNHRIIWIDAADINGNGPAEIFVSAVDTKGNLRSSVLEWDNGRLAAVVKNADWYFRVLHTPGQKPALFGQHRGVMGTKDAFSFVANTPFLAGVHRLTWQSGTYRKGETLPLPRQSNVFSFALADVTGEGRLQTIAFGDKDKLRLFDADGRQMWRSSAAFGGRDLYLEAPGDLGSRSQDTERFYLPQRLHVITVAGMDRPMIVTLKNHESGRRLLSRFRQFSRGEVVGLAWNNVALTAKWKTGSVDGYLSDLAVADLDGDGKPEIITALVNRTGSTLKKAQSFLVVRPVP